jgi:hypothetical protein
MYDAGVGGVAQAESGRGDAQRAKAQRKRFKAEGLSWAPMWDHKSELKKARELVRDLRAAKRAMTKAKI